jgi:RHS repeat-associated protein
LHNSAKTTGILSYLLNDDLGGTSLVLTSGGGVQAVQLYAPYGAVRYSQGTVPTTYNYTGQRLDSETGLLYYGFRYYDPVVGQFVRADSVESNAGGMDGYGYVGSNPESKTDPTGHYFIGERNLEQRSTSQTGSYAPAEYAWRTNDGGLKVVQYYGAYGPPVWNQYTPAEIHRYDPYWTGPSTWQKIKDGLGITNIQHTFNDPHASGWDKAGSILGAIANDVGNLTLAGSILFGGPEFAGAEGGLAAEGTSLLSDSGEIALSASKVDLYRAVGPSELDNLLRLGDYGLSPNESGKYFALTEKGAWDYALSTFNEGRPMTVTHIQVPSEMLDKGYIFFDSGGAGPSIHFVDDVLINDFYKNMGLPEIIGAPWAGWGP